MPWLGGQSLANPISLSMFHLTASVAGGSRDRINEFLPALLPQVLHRLHYVG